MNTSTTVSPKIPKELKEMIDKLKPALDKVSIEEVVAGIHKDRTSR